MIHQFQATALLIIVLYFYGGTPDIFDICTSWRWQTLYYHRTNLSTYKQLFINRPSKVKMWNITTIIWVTWGYFRTDRRVTENQATAFTLQMPKKCLYTKELLGFKSLRKYWLLFAWWVKYHKILHFFPRMCISCIKILIQCIPTFLIFVIPGNWLRNPIQLLSTLLQYILIAKFNINLTSTFFFLQVLQWTTIPQTNGNRY